MDDFDLIGPPDAPGPVENALQRRASRLAPFTRPQKEYAPDYVATEALTNAVNVALSLGRPLLLTGEPGSGKTLAARWITYRLGLSDDYFVEFQVRSDSRARDLRYEFDAVSWFRASQLAAARNDTAEVRKDGFIHPRALGIAFGWNGPSEKPFVVLVDEIDKAPRDFPNDLLLEFDQMRFTIEETGRIVGPPDQRPIIVITSNAERRLPDPFLRRCIVHNIELDSDTVMKILQKRLADFGSVDQIMLRDAEVFWRKLKTSQLVRSPSIAEFWQWLALVTTHGSMSRDELLQSLKSGADIEKIPYIMTILSTADLDRVKAMK
jgi:MoxR-like ATPase